MPLSQAEREITENRDAPSQDLLPKVVETLDRLWSERRHIQRWVAAGLVISVALAFYYPKYEATAQLMPPGGGSGSGLAALALPMLKSSELAGLAGMLGGDLFQGKGALFVKVLQSRTVEDKLVERFDLRQHYGVRYWEDARKKLEKRTTITEDKKSGIITIEVKDRNAGFASALAGAYVDALDHVIAQVSTSAARRERIFIEQRLAEERPQLEESEKQLSQFQSSSMAVDVPQQTRVMMESVARLQGELIAKRSQLEGLEQIYAPESPRIKSLRSEIGALERDLSRMNTGQYAPGSESGTNPYPSVKSLPALGVQWADLYRNSKIHEAIYELLTQQYETARIQEAKEIPTVKVLDAAVPPEKKYPRPITIVLAGVLTSFVLACVGASMKSHWEEWDESDPRRVLILRLFRRRPPVASEFTSRE